MTKFQKTPFRLATGPSPSGSSDLQINLVTMIQKSDKVALGDVFEEVLMHGHTVAQEALVLMQQEIYPPYFERPLSERVESALHLHAVFPGRDFRGSFCHMMDVFRRHLCHGPLDLRAFHVRTKSGMTILHWLTQVLVVNNQWNSPSLCALLMEAVEAGASLSPLHQDNFGNQFTPLMLTIVVLIWSMGYWLLNEVFSEPSYLLRKWVQGLYEAGADLLEYG